MKKTLFLLAIVGCLTVGLLAGHGLAEEQKVGLGDCPKAVQDTIKKEVGAGKLGDVEKEVEDGKTVYSAEFTLDGKKYEVEVSEDGKLIKKKLDDDKDEKQEEKK